MAYESKSKIFGCTVLSFIYLFILLFYLMGYVLLLMFLFSPEVLLFFVNLGIKMWKLMIKFGKKMGKCKVGKPLKLGPIKIQFNVFEILKAMLFFVLAVGCFIASIFSFILFIVHLTVSILIVLLNPIDVIDVLMTYSFLPGNFCVSSS